jgi:hypothetical protein
MTASTTGRGKPVAIAASGRPLRVVGMGRLRFGRLRRLWSRGAPFPAVGLADAVVGGAAGPAYPTTSCEGGRSLRHAAAVADFRRRPCAVRAAWDLREIQGAALAVVAVRDGELVELALDEEDGDRPRLLFELLDCVLELDRGHGGEFSTSAGGPPRPAEPIPRGAGGSAALSQFSFTLTRR